MGLCLRSEAKHLGNIIYITQTRVFTQLQIPADAETIVAAANAGFTPAEKEGSSR